MHARIDQLLNLRDGEPVDAQAASHVAQCSACTAELVRLSTVRRRMQELPSFEPPSWESVQESCSAARGRRSRYALAALAAGVAALSVAALFFSGGGGEQGATTVDVEIAARGEPLRDDDLADLMDRSRQLEEMLEVLPARPVVERVTTAATIDTLERRIQWLDLHLSYAPEAGLSERQAEHLWRERVDLMDSLVKVRYAESGYMSF